MTDYFIYILAYLIIGFVISLYIGKQKRYDTTGYVASGLLVMFWPVLIGLVAIMAAILLVLFAISSVSYLLGRLVYSMRDKDNNENKETNRETKENLS